MPLRQILAGLAFLALTATCSRTEYSLQAWDPGDLRSIDALDAAEPGRELAAAYARQSGEKLELRLDFLELSEIPDYDLYLALDVIPGGGGALPIDGQSEIEWDWLVKIPAAGQIEAFSPGNNPAGLAPHPLTGLSLFRNPLQDSVEIRLPTGRLSSMMTAQARLQAFVTPPGSLSVSDQIKPFTIAGQPPRPASAALVFWNSMPAFTPGQALRRWDGAHTGPAGGRHGLGNLLNASARYQAPLTLLDLNQPAALSALEALGQTGQVREMAQAGLLALPNVLPAYPPGADPGVFSRPPGPAAAHLLENDRRISREFQLPEQDLWFAPAGLAAADHATGNPAGLMFVPDPASAPASQVTRPILWQGRMILPVPWPADPAGAIQQVTKDGLAIETRRMLLQAVQDPNGVLLLGGDLATSAWGDPQAAKAGLAYLARHPWIKLFGGQDFLEMEADSAAAVLTPDSALPQKLPAWLDGLEAIKPDAQIGPAAAAWQAYRSLYSWPQPFQRELPALREHYSGQVGALLAAAAWADKPFSASDCESDPDFDGQVECRLASETVFALFELDYGGYLAYLFVRTEDGQVHQVAAPSTNLVSGANPAAGWDLSRGALADPRALPGGFYDPAQSASDSIGPACVLGQARSQSAPGTLRLSTAGERIKTFTLLPDGLEIVIQDQADQPLSASLPVMLDPWERFKPGWPGQYQLHSLSASQLQMSGPGSRLSIETTGRLAGELFNDAIDLLQHPEDPNREVPGSQSLPFPMGIVTFNGTGEMVIVLRLTKVKLMPFDDLVDTVR